MSYRESAHWGQRAAWLYGALTAVSSVIWSGHQDGLGPTLESLVQTFVVLSLGLPIVGVISAVSGPRLASHAWPATIVVKGGSLKAVGDAPSDPGNETAPEAPTYRIALRDVVASKVEATPGGNPHVTFVLASGNALYCDMDSPASAAALIAATGARPRLRRLEASARRWKTDMYLGCFATPFAVMAGALGAVSVAGAPEHGRGLVAALVGGALAACAVAAVARILGGSVRVGTDGIAFRHRLRRRFVPFSDLAAVDPVERAVVLRYRDGRTETVPLASDSPNLPSQVAWCVHDQLNTSEGAVAAESLLGRGGRPLAAWREAVVDLLRPRADYRAVAVSREDLLRVLADAHATIEHRLGAAMALAGEDDPEARTRIRVVAEESASAPVREAFAVIARGEHDEEALQQALDAYAAAGESR